ncbi:hypothetical protein Fmac_018270 [Flemingia macrophylla]|uniref:Gamma-interferon-inducible lysosomal thiol reductase n=1 Tax=Flemingia macrophylla TaxID=520843 RepID=A0ABD1M4I1_9FABA
MVSPKLSTITALALFFFIFTIESVGSSYHPSEDSPFASQKVNLSVYYASLCQPCATFIVKNLEGIFHGDLINIVNLQLVPWANASVDKTNHSIICQNGPDECELNSLEACALTVFNDVNKHYALIPALSFWQLREGTRIGMTVSTNWSCPKNLFWTAITQEMERKLDKNILMKLLLFTHPKIPCHG